MARAALLALLVLASGCLLPDIDADDWDGDGTIDAEDCDPTDPALNDRDDDGDGSSTCAGDCDDDDPFVEDLDVDQDGVSTCAGDCDDADPTVAPGRAEVCDGLDNNCDGVLPGDEVDADGDGAPACFDCDDLDPEVEGIDEDGDGFGPCTDPVDCDESNPSAFPGADDNWGDGIDQSCDGVDGQDDDQDGFAGNADEGSGSWDCDETNSQVHEQADEVCDGLDTDCDGVPLEGEHDDDGDGYLACDDYEEHGLGYDGGGDCEDDIVEANPDRDEVACDGVDTDCDGMIATSEQDGDGDGYLPCDGFEDLDLGLVGGGDCLDTNPEVHPGSWKMCDGLDSDCDGAPVDPIEFDSDGDGYVPCGWWQGDDPLVIADGDCDDSQVHVNPGALVELCDGLNTDCHGSLDIDEMDQDGDGWIPCSPYVDHGLPLSGGGDCADLEEDVYPGAAEHACDGIDSDCDGAPLAAGEADADGDGWLACSGYVDHGGGFGLDPDCDDSQAGVHPGASEECDSIDTNCDGATLMDELDIDGDGWVGCSPWIDRGAPVLGGGDCSEQWAGINPGATESCDGLDSDCDGALPDDEADLDGDFWLECEPYVERGEGYAGGDDCDDTSIYVRPNMVEEPCDGLDNDCNGIRFADEDDEDGDGWLACTPFVDRADFSGGDDCDDLDAGANPGTGWDDPSDTLDADCGAGTVTWLGRSHGTLVGSEELDWAGWSVAAVGNLDGDALADVVVGAIDGNSDSQPGKAWIVLGTTLAAGGTLSLNSADVRILGIDNGDNFGSSAVSLADLDGDGLDDLALGATGAGPGGKVYVFWSTDLLLDPDQDISDADVTIEASDAGDQLGHALASGDVTGDGVHDLLVGAPGMDSSTLSDVGGVYVFSGADLASATDAGDALVGLSGVDAGGEAGTAVAVFPDVNGDGLDEIVAGAPDADDGKVFFVHGTSSNLWSDLGAWAAVVVVGSPDDSAGYTLAVGDILDDGLPDLAIGAPDSGGWGQVYVFGRDNLIAAPVALASMADATLSGEEVDDWFGAGLAAGDLDGDGDDDLLVGAPTSDWGGEDAGGVWLFEAPVNTLSLPAAILAGHSAGDQAGWALAAGDVDGDGMGDLLVGAPDGDLNATDAGQVHVVLSEL